MIEVVVVELNTVCAFELNAATGNKEAHNGVENGHAIGYFYYHYYQQTECCPANSLREKSRLESKPR